MADELGPFALLIAKVTWSTPVNATFKIPFRSKARELWLALKLLFKHNTEEFLYIFTDQYNTFKSPKMHNTGLYKIKASC